MQRKDMKNINVGEMPSQRQNYRRDKTVSRDRGSAMANRLMKGKKKWHRLFLFSTSLTHVGSDIEKRKPAGAQRLAFLANKGVFSLSENPVKTLKGTGKARLHCMSKQTPAWQPLVCWCVCIRGGWGWGQGLLRAASQLIFGCKTLYSAWSLRHRVKDSSHSRCSQSDLIQSLYHQLVQQDWYNQESKCPLKSPYVLLAVQQLKDLCSPPQFFSLWTFLLKDLSEDGVFVFVSSLSDSARVWPTPPYSANLLSP